MKLDGLQARSKPYLSRAETEKREDLNEDIGMHR